MRMTRREFATLAGAAVLTPTLSARAESANVFVPGFNLPANLDPHQVLDVSATDYALNAYDNLYRWEDNPAKMQPVAGDELYRLGGRPDLGFQTASGRQIP